MYNYHEDFKTQNGESHMTNMGRDRLKKVKELERRDRRDK